MKINLYFHENNSQETVISIVFVLIDLSNRITFPLHLTLHYSWKRKINQ